MSKPQLFCFTYAGGNASFFDAIEKELNGINLTKCEYSGHGKRHNEPFYQDFDELTKDIFNQVMFAYCGGEYSLFGYSMGTITLVEVLKKIIADQLKLPQHVFLAAHEPHSKAELKGFAQNELDEWVKTRTISFGAVPEKLVGNQAFWRTYLPLYRADYSIIAKYKFEELDLRTTIPATVFYSESDTPYTEMLYWKKYFVGRCDYHEFDGTHFFIQEHYREIADIIRNELKTISIIS